MKKSLKLITIEIIPIIIGILIALWINNWNENRKDRNYINQISSSIDKELTETAENIIIKRTTQESLIDTLDYYKTDKDVSLFDIMMKVNGIQMPSIKINSWKAISNTKIELMEYSKVSTLADIEEQKDLLKVKSQNLMNFIYPNTQETGTEKKEQLKLRLLDIISTETTIQNQKGEIVSN